MSRCRRAKGVPDAAVEDGLDNDQDDDKLESHGLAALAAHQDQGAANEDGGQSGEDGPGAMPVGRVRCYLVKVQRHGDEDEAREGRRSAANHHEIVVPDRRLIHRQERTPRKLRACCLSRVSYTDGGNASAPALISVLGLGLIGAGTFGTDPIGSPATLHGDLHFLATIAIAGALSATCLILVPAIDNVSSSTWRRISVLTGFVVPALFLLSNVAPPFLLPGLVERAALILGAGWVATFASRVLRRM